MKMFLSIAFVLNSFSAMAATSFSCRGTEPFWNLEVSDKFLTYLDPMRKPMKLKVVANQKAAGFAENAAFVIKSKYSQASIALGECSDGMSEENYSHTVVLQINDTVLAGCCNQN